MRVSALITALSLLAACQSATTGHQTSQTSQKEQYQAVIVGGLGVNFDDGVSKLIAMGFEENQSPRKQYEVGDWEIPLSKADGFFNFGMEAATGPISGRIFSIEGRRFYPRKSFLNHYDECDSDRRLLQAQIEQKYPSLHKWYEPGLNQKGESVSVSFHEGKGSYQYSSSPRHFGRTIYLSCYIQTSGNSILGSLLRITYSEALKQHDVLEAEQKKVFSQNSRRRLEDKGFSSDNL
jgi:hypothetical protein